MQLAMFKEKQFGIIIAVAILVALVVLGNVFPVFFGPSNILNILSQSSVLAIMAIGLCFVIVVGGIDLSIVVSFDLGAMVAMLLLKAGIIWPIAFVAGLATGLLIGLINSFMVVKVKVSPFLTTLGTMLIGQSIEKIVTHGGDSIFISGMPGFFVFLGRGSVYLKQISEGSMVDFKFSVLLAILLAIVTYFVLCRTIFGRNLSAVGAQSAAAELSGVSVGRYVTYAFMISGVFSALAGLVAASVASGFVPMTGSYYMLDAIGAVFVGSIISKRKTANIQGTLVGVILFGIVANALNIAGVHYYWQNVVRGSLILIVLGFDGILGKNVLVKKKVAKI
jgi:ribose transport system permease protein